jgi:hypothetical protein
LDAAWTPGGGDLAEVAVGKSGAHVLKLHVVKAVEAFEAKLKTAAPRFAEKEAVKERQIPVVTARTSDGTFSEVAPSTRSGQRKYGCIEELVTVCG